MWTSIELLQGGRNAAEGRVQVGSEGLYGDDDCHRNAGRDQTILNSRRAGLILAELTKNSNHE